MGRMRQAIDFGQLVRLTFCSQTVLVPAGTVRGYSESSNIMHHPYSEPHNARRLPARQARGMALIIVLIFVALLAILIVSFMAGASFEVASSKNYAASVSTQNLAASALNLAMGQVSSGAKSDSQTVSWADSQLRQQRHKCRSAL